MHASSKPHVHASIAALALLVAFAPPARASWPHDPYVGNLALCTQAGTQTGVRAVSDGAGGAIVAWQDSRAATGPDIYVQRVDANGTALWTSSGVALCVANNDQSIPTIVSDGAGGAIVAWQDLRSGTNYDIYAQRVNANGTVQWTANGVPLCQAALGQTQPQAVADGSGGIIVTWMDARTSGVADIYTQRVNASGVVQWTANGVATCTATNFQYYPQIASDGAGGAVVTWEDYRGSFGDVYAQRLNAAGATQWTTDGVAVCNATADQIFPRIVTDGQGGALLTWQDSRAGGSNVDVYAQRLSGSGTALWTTNGVAVCTATANQSTPIPQPDGSGGIVVAWQDQRSGTSYDVYAQRIMANGQAGWAANGVAVVTGTGDQLEPSVVSDGQGGLVVGWYDTRSGIAPDIYAQRVTSTGAVRWAANGQTVCAAVGSQVSPVLVADGVQGAIVAWPDFRNDTGLSDVYAQRVDGNGELGNAEPRIASVRDVLNDQGGAVKITFAASYLDVERPSRYYQYKFWRSVPAASFAQAAAARRGSTTSAREAIATGKLLVLTTSAGSYAWETLGDLWIDPVGLSTYSIVAPTTSDSIGGSNPRTAFMVSFLDYGGNDEKHWFSAPDSGYSVDNLAPVTPAPFAANAAAGSTHLSWNPNHEADLAGYRLYRGSSVSFVPSPANLIHAQPDTGYVDPSGAAAVYKLTAVDVHGNESPVATAVSTGTTGIAETGASALAFATPSPNPARNATLLRWSLPAAANVWLAVYDAAGRRVRILADGAMPAGEHSTSFALDDDAGRHLPSGLYLVRLETPGGILTRRLAAIQ